MNDPHLTSPVESANPVEAKVRVLLVDDQAMIGEAVRRQLSKEPDIEFHFCPDGKEALRFASSIRPTVILQDLVMPGINGLDLVRQYRATLEMKETPVIVLSTKEDPLTKSDAFVAGANDYLVKLPDKVELLARIRYHSRAYLNQILREQAYRALRESEQQLVESNTELVSLNQRLEEATKAKSQFLATISHEIRTPMNGVIGMATLLLDTELIDQQRDFVETIRSSGESLLAIINDVLDFSKIESGQMELENTPFELRTCIEEALDLLAAKAAEKKIDLSYLLEESVPLQVSGDVTRLRQVLVNLISNSVKFTARGEVVLMVEKDLSDPAHASGRTTLHFAVRDTGIGIPEEKLDRLFKSFSQVDSSTTRQYGGTGLGLAICKRIVELMGGRIWVETKEGEGSTFHFIVRLTAIDSESRPALSEIRYSGKTLLVVEHNATNGSILTQIAQGMGLGVQVLKNSSAALSWLQDGNDCALVLLDQQLPEMEGLKLAGEIHRMAGRESLPLVLLSSIRLSPRDERMKVAGISHLIYKPIRRSQASEVLSAVFGESAPVRKLSEFAAVDRSLASRLPLSLLLADDNPINRKVGERFLQKMGYQVEMATNGIEVIEALEKKSYDIIFLDVQMPEMDGYETARQIGLRWKGNRPRLIAVTGNALQGDREKCLEAGMDDYITKPIQAKEVEMKLLHWGEKKIRDGSASG